MTIDTKKLAKQVGATIAFHRQQSGLTQEQVAEKLGIGNEAISRMERGIAIPTAIRLVEFAEIFGCKVTDLLVKNSQRKQDQKNYINHILEEVNQEERELVVGVVEKLVHHFNQH